MDEYIDLDRSFAPIPRDYEWSEEEETLAFAFENFELFEKQCARHIRRNGNRFRKRICLG